MSVDKMSDAVSGFQHIQMILRHFPCKHFNCVFTLHKPYPVIEKMSNFYLISYVILMLAWPSASVLTLIEVSFGFLCLGSHSPPGHLFLSRDPIGGAHPLLFLIFSITYIKISTEAVITSPPSHQIVMSVTCPPFPEPAVPHASAAQALCPSNLSAPGVGSGELVIFFIVIHLHDMTCI